jgi:RecA-family ATPase
VNKLLNGTNSVKSEEVLKRPVIPNGQGVHQDIFERLRDLRNLGVSPDEAYQLVRAIYPHRPQSEFNGTARSFKPMTGGSYDRDRGVVRYKPCANPIDFEPVREPVSTVEFLSRMFRPGEIICATNCSIESGEKLVPGDAGTFWTLEKWIEEFAKSGKAFLSGEAGAWVRINPIKPDDKSGRDASVSNYRYLLVECDARPKDEQFQLLANSGLPIACLIDSGGKSVHAWIKVDASNAEEFKERQELVYGFLEPLGIDQSNINPSRFARLPGIFRGPNEQKFLTWGNEITWVDSEGGLFENGLKSRDVLDLVNDELIKEDPFVFKDLFRTNSLLQITGGSKTKKSHLVNQLTICASHRVAFMGFECAERAKVLYIDGEQKDGTFKDRLTRAANSLELELNGAWFRRASTRGKNLSIDFLKAEILRENRRHGPFGVIVIDPVYKYYGSLDENSNSDMGVFYGLLMEIAEETSALVIPIHHHSKGQQGMKRPLDRASGAGAMGRTVDYNMDIMFHRDDAGKCKQYVISTTSRDLPDKPDFSVEFDGQVFRRDYSTEPAIGTSSAGSKWDILDCIELAMAEVQCDCEITDCECPKFEGISSGDLRALAEQKGVRHTRFSPLLKQLAEYVHSEKIGRSIVHRLKGEVVKEDGKWKKSEAKFIPKAG